MVELKRSESSLDNRSSLTKNIRLMIYGYLPTRVILCTISKLSKTERQNLVGSNLASADREVEFTHFDPSKHGFLLEIVDIAGFCFVVKEDSRGQDLAEQMC